MAKQRIRLGVSLYSYQEAIWRGDLDLAGAMTAAKGCGAEGVEIFGEALMRSFPYVSDEFLYEWNYLLDNLQLEPVCYEHFADRRFWQDPDRYLNDDDIFEGTLQYLRTAKKLGCKFIRLSHDGHNGTHRRQNPAMSTVNEATFERLLPYAAELGVKMALEVHAPGTLQDGGNDGFLEAIERTGCHDGGGLMLDFSCCFRDISPMREQELIKSGIKPEILTWYRQLDRRANTFDGHNEVDWQAVETEVLCMGAGEAELKLLHEQYHHGPLKNRSISSPAVVRQYARQLCYVHGKLHWIEPDGTCDEMDYPRYLKALVEGGYQGWISTEFEGQRSVPHTLNEVEFVRRQQDLMRKCLAEA